MQLEQCGSPTRCDSPSTIGHHPNIAQTTENRDLSASSGSFEVVHGSTHTSTEGSWQLHTSVDGYPSKPLDISSTASSKVVAEHQLNDWPKTLFAVVCNPTDIVTRRSMPISPLSVDCFEPQLVFTCVSDSVEQTCAVTPDDRSQLYVSSEHITLEPSRLEVLLQSQYTEAGSKFQLESQKLRHISGKEIVLQYPQEEPQQNYSPSRKLSVDEIQTECDQETSGREIVLQYPPEEPIQEYSPPVKLCGDEIRTESDKNTSGTEIVLKYPQEEPMQEYSPSRKFSFDEIRTESDPHTSGREIVLQYRPEEPIQECSPSRKLSVDEIRTKSDQHSSGTVIVLQYPQEESLKGDSPSRNLSFDDNPTGMEELDCTSRGQDPDFQVFVINCWLVV